MASIAATASLLALALLLPDPVAAMRGCKLERGFYCPDSDTGEDLIVCLHQASLDFDFTIDCVGWLAVVVSCESDVEPGGVCGNKPVSDYWTCLTTREDVTEGCMAARPQPIHTPESAAGSERVTGKRRLAQRNANRAQARYERHLENYEALKRRKARLLERTEALHAQRKDRRVRRNLGDQHARRLYHERRRAAELSRVADGIADDGDILVGKTYEGARAFEKPEL